MWRNLRFNQEISIRTRNINYSITYYFNYYLGEIIFSWLKKTFSNKQKYRYFAEKEISVALEHHKMCREQAYCWFGEWIPKKSMTGMDKETTHWFHMLSQNEQEKEQLEKKIWLIRAAAC